jgi:hypothetical protein
MSQMDPKKLVAVGVKWLLIALVAAFTALLSYNFWAWTFPPEQWYFAILGFSLTGGAVVGYAIVFMWDDGSPLQQTIALGMLIVSIIGEIVTAGYGIKIESWTRAGIVPTQQDYDFMQMAVQVLLLFHFVAVIVSYMGDRVAHMFELKTGKDYNRDGYIGKPPNKGGGNRPQNAPVSRPQTQGATQQQQGTQYTLEQFCAQIGLTPSEARSMIAGITNHDVAFKMLVKDRDMSDNTDISGKNFRKMFYRDLNPTNAAVMSNNGRH